MKKILSLFFCLILFFVMSIEKVDAATFLGGEYYSKKYHTVVFKELKIGNNTKYAYCIDHKLSGPKTKSERVYTRDKSWESGDKATCNYKPKKNGDNHRVDCSKFAGYLVDGVNRNISKSHPKKRYYMTQIVLQTFIHKWNSANWEPKDNPTNKSYWTKEFFGVPVKEVFKTAYSYYKGDTSSKNNSSSLEVKINPPSGNDYNLYYSGDSYRSKKFKIDVNNKNAKVSVVAVGNGTLVCAVDTDVCKEEQEGNGLEMENKEFYIKAKPASSSEKTITLNVNASLANVTSNTYDTRLYKGKPNRQRFIVYYKKDTNIHDEASASQDFNVKFVEESNCSLYSGYSTGSSDSKTGQCVVGDREIQTTKFTSCSKGKVSSDFYVNQNDCINSRNGKTVNMDIVIGQEGNFDFGRLYSDHYIETDQNVLIRSQGINLRDFRYTDFISWKPSIFYAGSDRVYVSTLGYDDIEHDTTVYYKNRNNVCVSATFDNFVNSDDAFSLDLSSYEGVIESNKVFKIKNDEDDPSIKTGVESEILSERGIDGSVSSENSLYRNHYFYKQYVFGAGYAYFTLDGKNVKYYKTDVSSDEEFKLSGGNKYYSLINSDRFDLDVSIDNLSHVPDVTWRLSGGCGSDVYIPPCDGPCSPGDDGDPALIIDYRSIDINNPFPKSRGTNWPEGVYDNRLANSYDKMDYSIDLPKSSLDTIINRYNVNSNYFDFKNISEDGSSALVRNEKFTRTRSSNYCRVGEFNSNCDK